ncbi:MAG: cupin domain-containing protein [Gemmatimonadetes bacterium]|nr:cupin domain-containing protein [Gemmatimonadota bacterium]
MTPIIRYEHDYRWEGVPVHAYKEGGSHFRDVTRQLLLGGGAGAGWELRYFEIQPDGHSTLERHQHAHAVVVIRGRGRVLIDPEIGEIRPFDLVLVPPLTWHQFRAAPGGPLGFLCLVEAERDRPVRPSDAEIEALRARPEVAAFIRE